MKKLVYTVNPSHTIDEGEGSWVRITVPSAAQINDAITKILHRKAESITHNKELRHYINEKYLEAVTPYVPRSNDEEKAYNNHHLQDAIITSDGRIIWSAKNKGYNYAYIQYVSLSYKHPKRYTGHKPTAYWLERVVPGNTQWNRVFIPSIRKAVKEAYKDG